MSYFQFLLIFLGIPLVLLSGLCLFQNKVSRKVLPPSFKSWNPTYIIIGLIIVAIVWTTPWDNYLVATRVWWYDPNLVTGLVIGYVPVEEYTFFILQTALTGMLTVFLIKQWPKYMAPADFQPNHALIRVSAIITAILWIISTVILLSGYPPAIYMTLILSWALIPIFIQMVFGADILWHYRRILFWGIVPITLYLAAADSLAIQAGTWTISEEKTLGILIGPILPLEEFTFFLITNVLVVFGVTLLLAQASHRRSETIPILKSFVQASKADVL